MASKVLSQFSNIFLLQYQQVDRQFQYRLIVGIQCRTTKSENHQNKLNLSPLMVENIHQTIPCTLFQIPQHRTLLGIIKKAKRNIMLVLSLLTCRIWIQKDQIANNLSDEQKKLSLRKIFVADEDLLHILYFRTHNQRDEIYNKLKERELYFKVNQSHLKFQSCAMRYFVELDSYKTDEILDKKQLKNLFALLNINEFEVEKYLAEFDSYIDRGEIEFEDFKKLLKLMQCQEQLYPLYQEFCRDGKNQIYKKKKPLSKYLDCRMTVKNFHQFLQIFQRNEKQERAFYSLVYKGEQMSFVDFSKYLCETESNNGTITDNRLFQDLPLPCYYIHSSHNTYLTGNQLTSSSSAYIYYQNLKQGVRCLEIDIHNGKEGPIVKHGYTLTTQISFENVILEIRKFSIQEDDHTPIILSFENHCNQKNQIKMADIWKKRIPSHRYITILNGKPQEFKTLKQLRGKIIIQGTGNFSELFPNVQVQQLNGAYVDRRRTKLAQKLPQPDLLRSIKFEIGGLVLAKGQNLLKQNNKLKIKMILFERNKRKWLKKRKSFEEIIQKSKAKLQNQYISLQLSKIFGVIACPFQLKKCSYKLLNIAQNKILRKLQQGQRIQLIIYSESNFIRVYPFGLRFNSSNYNFVPMMEVGAQMISLNTQNIDIFSIVNRSLYLQNGNCGYLMKPLYMLNPTLKAYKEALKYTDIQTEHSFKIDITFLSVSNLIPCNKIYENDMTELCISFIGTREDMKKNIVYVKNGQVRQQHDIGQNDCEKIILSDEFQARCLRSIIVGKKNFVIKKAIPNHIIINRSPLNLPPTVSIVCQSPIFANLFIEIRHCGAVGLPLKKLRHGYRSIAIYDFSGQKPIQKGTILCFIQKN